MLQMPKLRQKEETGEGILAQFPPLLVPCHQFEPWHLEGTEVQHSCSHCEHEGECEQKAVANVREIMKMNISIFQEDNTTNKN